MAHATLALASLVSVLTVAVPQAVSGSAAAGLEDGPALVGTWRGDSLCAEKGTACRDEIAVYRIAAVPGKRGLVMVTGGKMVDGKEVVMGTGDGRYDAATHTLTIEEPQGVISLKINGDTLVGTFTRPNKQVLRRISLKKSPDSPGSAAIRARR